MHHTGRKKHFFSTRKSPGTQYECVDASEVWENTSTGPKHREAAHKHKITELSFATVTWMQSIFWDAFPSNLPSPHPIAPPSIKVVGTFGPKLASVVLTWGGGRGTGGAFCAPGPTNPAPSSAGWGGETGRSLDVGVLHTQTEKLVGGIPKTRGVKKCSTPHPGSPEKIVK